MPKEAIVQPSTEAVEIIDTPIPVPTEKQVIIKVVVSGSNPKDWKMPLWKDLPHNPGDDIAGIVHAVGKDVYEFKPGDRVAAFHETGAPNGSYAEYAIAADWTTFHLPPSVSFEEAATIPAAALTAALGLFGDMKLPAPFDQRAPIASAGKKDAPKQPLLIYGATSAVGAFAAKLARLSGFSPVIGIAGRAGDFAKTLVDHVIDYRGKSEDDLVAAVQAILAKEGLNSQLTHIFDAISSDGSFEVVSRLIDPNGGVVSVVLPPVLFAKDGKNFRFPDGVTWTNTAVPYVHWDYKDFGYVWSRYLGRLLAEGRLTGHPYEIVPGGLHGVVAGLQKLKSGKNSASKYVFRIRESKDFLGMVGADGHPSNVQRLPEGRKNSHPLRNFPFLPED